ncbi:hypothetical protein KC19_VG098300 [Ceratodon purpureus]|uniref:Uncharacterized protein n=1 Tax=Ceratodon purpureus TaxID=3225 RepID=A0A8T0HNR5_CERPU|nr:hypothetical protein KC19_VG098300 [Ceratodon purpureus]KAG0572477.1 hypothetical protein KC19_VG098300 [Ceratodon purpureus]
MVNSIKKDFTKYLHLANPKNCKDFLEEINRHFSEFPKAEMTLDKLQKIVLAAVEAKFKARWLRWWNSLPSLTDFYL